MENNNTANFLLDTNNDFVRQLASNVKSDVIVITEDKLENILLKYLKKIDISQSWISPLSLLISIILSLLTADFSNSLYLTKDTWKAIFVIGAFASSIWLVITLLSRYKNKNNTIESLIKNIKNIENN